MQIPENMKRYEFNPVVQPLFDKVDCSGLMLIPNKIYYEWSQFIVKGRDPLNNQEAEFFLLPQFNSPEKTEEFCRLFFDLFFQYKLRQGSSDPAFWPKGRTFKMFQQWFDLKITNVVSSFKWISFNALAVDPVSAAAELSTLPLHPDTA